MFATVHAMADQPQFLRRMMLLMGVRMTDDTREKILSKVQGVVEEEYMKDEHFIEDSDLDYDKEYVRQLPDRVFARSGTVHKPYIEDVHCVDLYVERYIKKISGCKDAIDCRYMLNIYFLNNCFKLPF